MTPLRILLSALALAATVSCSSTGRVDARYPTVDELDRMDTQWGLTQRKSRGAPKRTYQYTAPAPSYAPATVPEPSAPPREVIQGLPPGSPQ